MLLNFEKMSDSDESSLPNGSDQQVLSAEEEKEINYFNLKPIRKIISLKE